MFATCYANLDGLGKAMVRDGSLDSENTLKAFAAGFTQSKSTFDFVDVGRGKERADNKLKGKAPDLLPSLHPGRTRLASTEKSCLVNVMACSQTLPSGTFEITTANRSSSASRTMQGMRHMWTTCCRTNISENA